MLLSHPDRGAPLARDVIGTLQEPFLALDAEHRVQAASPAFAATFGFSLDRVVGCRLMELSEAGWGGEPLRALLEDEAPRGPGIEGRLLELPGADGLLARFSVNVRPVREGASRISGFFLSFARVAAPGEASDEEILTRLAGRHAVDLLAIYRPDGSCRYVGEGCEAVLGYTRAEWLALPACRHLHPVDREACAAALRRTAEAGEARGFTLRVRCRTGEYAWLDMRLRPVEHPEEGTLIHVSAREVTRERRAEEALRWLTRQTRLVLDSAAEGIFGVDRRGVVTFANPAAARLLRLRVPELMGHSYRRFAKDVDEVEDTLADGVAREVTGGAFSRSDGTPVEVDFSCNPMRLHGEVVGAVVTFRDVSERNEAAALHSRARWLEGVEQTVDALRHEINNPLTALLAETSLLAMGGNSPVEEQEMVASIAEHARRIRDVMRRLTEHRDDAHAPGDAAQPMFDLTR